MVGNAKTQKTKVVAKLPPCNLLYSHRWQWQLLHIASAQQFLQFSWCTSKFNAVRAGESSSKCSNVYENDGRATFKVKGRRAGYHGQKLNCGFVPHFICNHARKTVQYTCNTRTSVHLCKLLIKTVIYYQNSVSELRCLEVDVRIIRSVFPSSNQLTQNTLNFFAYFSEKAENIVVNLAR